MKPNVLVTLLFPEVDNARSTELFYRVPCVGEYVRLFHDRWVVTEVEHSLSAREVFVKVVKAQ